MTIVQRYMVALIAIFVVEFYGPLQDASGVDIMPFGDSITSGFFGGPSIRGGYRRELEKTFLALGADFDFVGEFRAGGSYGLIDTDMQAKLGFSIEQVTEQFAGGVAQYQPEIVLVLVGTNNHWAHPIYEDFVLRYETLVNMIHTNSPESEIVIATVPKFGCCRAEAEFWTQEWVDDRNSTVIPNMNRALTDVAEKHAFIEVVDYYSTLDPTTDLVEDGDFVHPNIYGARKLADVFLSAIASHDRGLFDADSIDTLANEIRNASTDLIFDLDGSGQVDAGDLDFFVHELLETEFGDSDLDGAFQSSDLVSVFTAGQYEDDTPQNSTWATGDWNGDREFTTSDIVAALVDGTPLSRALVVPEPASLPLIAVGLMLIHERRRCWHTRHVS